MKLSGSFRAFTYLSLFGLAITIPLVLVFGALLLQSASTQRTQLEARVLQVLNALVNDVDREFDRDIAILHTLATSEALANADWRTFYKQANAGLQGRAYLVLIDSTGRQLVNTYVPYGEQPARTGDPETLRRILQTKAPVVSNLFTSLVVKKPVFNVSVPIMQGDQVRYIMSLGLVPNDVTALLNSQKLGPEWVTLIWDANGVLLARSRDNDRDVGKPLPQNMREHAQPAIVRTTNLDGTDVLHATAHSVVSGWGVGVNVPYSLVTGQIRNSLFIWGAAGLLAISIALVSGLFFARQVTKPLSVAADAADAFGRGEIFPLAGSRLKEADAFLSTLQNAQQAREKLTEEIRQNRDWLHTTLNSIGDAVITTDASGRISFLNAVAQTLTGWNQDEATGKPLEEVFVIQNEETGKKVENPVSKVLRIGNIVGLANHTELIAKDGRRIAIDDSAAPICDVVGRVAGVVMVFRDISAQRQAEAATRRLASIVESSNDAIIGKDLNGVIRSWNGAAERIFGFTAAEVIGKPVEILAAPGHVDEMSEILQRIRSGERIEHFETVRKTKHGNLINISLTVSPVHDGSGQIVGASKIVRDVTERKEFERQLALSEERLSLVMKYLPIGVGVVNAEGRVLIANPVFRNFLDGDIPSIDDKESTKWRGYYPDGHLVERQNYPAIRALRGEEVVPGIDFLHTNKDGVETWVRVSAVPFRSPEGKIIGALTLVQDIDKEQRAAAALRESAAELRISNEALLRANEDLSQFAFAASHDLQEPLRMITSFAQMLLKGYRGQLEGEAETCIKFITAGTKRMRELLADLLAYTQLTGEEEAAVECVDFNDAFQTAVENCRAAIDETGATVTSDLLPTVLGHKPHFVQLFQNLISNGLKYRSDLPPRIHVSAAQQSGVWRIAVKDNGMGIDPEYHEQIFGVFKRLHGQTIPGTGIGLAICKRVVERYGGKIWVESQPDQGATFYFTFSAAPKGAAAHD